MSNIPFIGSKISITTSSDIRYEGTLHAIDTAEATVSLENDIKDLNVIEPPKPTSMVDPAIISMPKPKPIPTNPPQQQPARPAPSKAAAPLPATTAAAPTSLSHQAPSARIPTFNTAPPTARIPTASAGAAHVTQTQVAPKQSYVAAEPKAALARPVAKVVESVQVASTVEPVRAANPPMQTKPTIAAIVRGTQSYYTADSTPQKLDERKPARNFDENDQRPAYKQQPQRYQPEYQRRNSSEQGGPHRGRGSYRGSYTGDRTRKPSPRGIFVPRSEFDIQSSNAKFDKEKLVDELEAELQNLAVSDNLQSIQTATFYDKSYCFFDNISCETKLAEKEHVDIRTKNADELKMNVETFGRPYLANSHRGYYRGGGRGGRGYYNNNGNSRRGGYYGGRGYYQGEGGSEYYSSRQRSFPERQPVSARDQGHYA